VGGYTIGWWVDGYKINKNAQGNTQKNSFASKLSAVEI
jgi:hypothetical protein